VFREDPKPGEKSGVPCAIRRRATCRGGAPSSPIPSCCFATRRSPSTRTASIRDRTYCIETEGYPGLVVHGPFAQQCIFDLLRDSLPGRKIKTLAVRARAPLFDTAPFDVIGRPTADGKGRNSGR